MAKSGPGKHYRKGLTLAELFEMFPNDDTAEELVRSETLGR